MHFGWQSRGKQAREKEKKKQETHRVTMSPLASEKRGFEKHTPWIAPVF